MLLGEREQITFVHCRASSRFAHLPGSLLTGESSSRAGFQSGNHQIQITSAPQLSTEAQVLDSEHSRSFLQEIST